MRVTVKPGFVGGTVAAIPSKSIAHRALICAGLAQGESRITGLAMSQDIAATARALKAFGVGITPIEGGLSVLGVGGRLRCPDQAVDCGESGSTLRFLIPLAAGCGRPVTFAGHGRLMQRPQTVYADLFSARGLTFCQQGDELVVCGPLPGGAYTVDGSVSSQFISGLLLALPLLGEDSTLTVTPPFESRSYVGLTLAAMARAGVEIADENPYRIRSGQQYRPGHFAVEGDWSNAAFPAVLGAVRGGVCIEGLDPSSRQGDRVVLDTLARCGARYAWQEGKLCFSPPTSPLVAADTDLSDCPDLGPILMVLALFCRGRTVLRGARRLRLKESDRVQAMEQEIRALGGRIESDENTVTVWGAQGALHGGACQSHNDHRIAMSMAVAGLAAGVALTIDDAQAVAKSDPDFFRTLASLCKEGSIVETH